MFFLHSKKAEYFPIFFSIMKLIECLLYLKIKIVCNSIGKRFRFSNFYAEKAYMKFPKL